MPNVNLEYFIVGGGGAGGSNAGGGGGGGQALNAAFQLPVGYSGAITIGAGGFTAGAVGQATTIQGVVSAAGGKAGFSDNYNGGASGGGLGGGFGNSTGGGGGGGGGGAGGNASNGGGAGGPGGDAVWFFGVTRFITGGGGGGGAEAYDGGNGWGGGGHGGRGDLAGGYIPPVAAVPNTGAGGGGGNGPAGALGWLGSVGGSGIVGIRYPLSSGIVASGGSILDYAGYRVHTFTANGTFTIASANTTVPNVVGQTQANADAAITAAGLVPSASSASSTSVPAGQVISQNPPAGTVVPSGSGVTYIVSSGLPNVTVPNVVGMLQATAQNTIQSAGLTPGAVTQASSMSVPAGVVISQNPVAGTVLPYGSAVTIVVSSGLPNVIVPNVVGQMLGPATTAITNANLSLGPVTTGSHPTIPAGSIISQNPAAGSSVPWGTAVALVNSTGVGTESPSTGGRITQDVIEILSQPNNFLASVTQYAVELLLQNWAEAANVSQVVLETLTVYEHYLITVTPPTLAPVWPGDPYSQQLGATGSPHGGYTFSLVAGTLPDGLTLTSDGLISGIPTEIPVFGPPTLTGIVDTPVQIQLTVSNPAAAHPFTVQATDSTGMAGTQAYTPSTWVYPLRWTRETPLPPCLGLSIDGVLSGSAMRVGSTPLTIRVTDAVGHSMTFTYTFTAGPKP